MSTSTTRTQSKFNLPLDLIQRLSRKVPRGQRSKFVEAAIDKALKETAEDDFFALLDTMPRVPTSGQDSVEVLRQLRQDRTEYVVNRHQPLAQ